MGDSSVEKAGEKRREDELLGGLYRYVNGVLATLDKAGISRDAVDRMEVTTAKDGVLELQVVMKFRLNEPRANSKP